MKASNGRWTEEENVFSLTARQAEQFFWRLQVSRARKRMAVWLVMFSLFRFTR
jgi:hypothetical protein